MTKSNEDRLAEALWECRDALRILHDDGFGKAEDFEAIRKANKALAAHEASKGEVSDAVTQCALGELAEIADCIPGVTYMDPPDGGAVTIAEQVRRMAKDAERYRWLRDGCDAKHSEATRIATNCWGMEWDKAIDAAILAARKEKSDEH